MIRPGRARTNGQGMRLCYIANGTSIHTKRWVNYFARKGHDVHLISSKFSDAGESFDSGVNLHQLVRLFPRAWQVSGYISGIFWPLQVRRMVRHIEPDILDAHFIRVPGYLGAISGFHPLVLTPWGSDILITPKRNPLLRILTKRALKRADMVICDSETVREELLKLGTTPSTIAKVFNGIDTQQFSPRRRDEELMVNLGLAEAPTIVCIRHLSPIYNVEMLIRAIPLILEKAPQARFIVAGDGEQRGYLEDLARSLGVSDSTRFIGWISHDELPNYLASSDIYVSTSLSDSTSLSLQEAMACELASVVTDLPANREWIVDGVNGLVASVDDIQGFADKVGYLLEDADLRREFGAASRRIIEEKAEYEKNMQKVESLYEQLVKHKSLLAG